MKFWLIGPREQDPLDAGIERSRLPFPVRFFSARNPVAPLAAGAAGVLLLEPLKRLLPPDIFSLDLPLIGLCSPSDLPAALTRRLLALLDGVIPLEAGPVSPKDSLPGLPLSPVTVWNLGPQHRPLAEPMPLFARSYVTQHSWSPFLPLYEQLASKPAYFIGTHPGRLPFYLQRSSLVLMDEPLNSLYLQALACGAKLALPAASPALGDLGALLNAEDYLAFAGDEGAEAQLAAYTAAPPPAGLGARLDQLRLASTLPRALQSLANLGPGPRDPLPIALQLACLTRPQALQRLEASLKTRPEGSDRDFLTLCFYQRLLQSPLAPTDKAPIHAAVAALLSQLPPGPERELIQLSTWIGQPEQEIQALSLLQQLQGSPPDFERISQPAAWLQDPVLGELLSLYDGNRALSAWLGYQEAVCLARLQRAGAARDRLEALLDQGYFPAAASLWQALQDQVPPTAKTRRWLDKHPQNLDLTLLWIRGLDEQAALNACAAARELCRRHLTRSADLEKFLALERQLRGEEPAPGVHVLWEGPLHAHSSLAAINQRWLLALLEQPGFRVTHIPFEPPELPPEPATQALERIWTQPVDVYVSHRWPPRNSPPTAGKWASIIPWEFGVIPESWARQLNAQLDRIWVPSAFVAQSFEISGVEADLLQVIPNGVDTQLLNPDGPRLELATQQGFRFLFVGGMLDRKGLDLLLDAYAAAFSRADDVVLVIKGFGSDSHYALHPFHHQLEALRSQPLAPAVLYLDQDLSAAQMAALYRACDVYVHPYRGEGFGMPILEAMACGLPVIIPNAGPAPEFCPPDAGWQVPTRIRFEPGCDVQGLGLAVTHPYYAEVDVTQLAASLKQAQSDPAECQRRGAIAATAAQVYDWQLIFPLLADQITALARQATPRAQRASRRGELLHSLAAGELAAAALQQLLPEDPLLLEALLTQLPPDEIAAAWRQGLAAGLPLAEARRIAQALPRLRRRFPLRLCWNPGGPPPLLRPLGNENLAVLQEPVHPDAVLSFVPAAGAICWLTERILPQNLGQPAEIWYSHPQQRAELLARGLPAEKLHYQPLGVDFATFSPAPLPAREHFVFLSIFDWERDGGWQELLRAYFAAFGESDTVQLLVKPLGEDFEAMVAALTDWIEAKGFDPEAVPALSFSQEELDPAQLPGLYRSADCFVAAHANSGIWHLAAQACGLPVISQGHFPFLERPFSEIYSGPEHLGWLLRQHWLRPEPGRGRIVREFLRLQHDRTPWQQRAEDRLIRGYLADSDRV